MNSWRRPEEELDGLDEAVINEKKRVMSGYASDDLLVVKNLTKEFKRGRREFYAVDHISVGVPRGEVGSPTLMYFLYACLFLKIFSV